MDLSSPKKAREFIEVSGIKIETTKVFNIYECGCVFENGADPIKMAYFPETRITNRTCLIHRPTSLHIKYKRCQCGFENTGKRLQESIGCGKCKNENKIEKMKDLRRRQNLHLKDVNRCDCAEYLDCLDKYLDCDCIPCKKCKKYHIGSANIDPLIGVYRNRYIKQKIRRIS